MRPTRVLHLTGSPVSSFFADLSRLYARGCLAAVAEVGRYEFFVAYVDPAGRWRFPATLDDGAVAAAEPMPLPAAIAHLAGLRIDVAVPQMFCRPGMTSYRALLDVLGIRYVGNTPDVMALGADKAKAKAVVGAAGVAVPAGEVLRRGDRVTRRPPVVVKPGDADNSVGVSLVTDPAEFERALEDAFAHSETVLVEDYVELGREVRCGVLAHDGDLVCLPLEEYDVDPVAKPIRGHADKIRRAEAGLELVAKDPARAWIVGQDDPIAHRVEDAAKTCHTALGCRHYSLFDFRVDPAGRPWFLEAGLYNSFAPSSVLVTMAAAAGITLDELFRDALGAAARP